MPFVIDAGSARHRSLTVSAVIAAIAVIVAAPYVAGTVSRVDTLSQIAAYSVAAIGLIVVMGYCGQVSLAHSAFVGLGGFTTVILAADHGWPYLATVPVAALIGTGVGAVIGLPSLRIRGLYLAVVTLAIAALFPSLVLEFEELTGGTSGKLAVDAMHAPDWLWVNPYTREGPAILRFYAIALVCVVMMLLARSLVRSRYGRAMIAVREAPLSAATSGIHVGWIKILAFAVSGLYGGVAGALLAIQLPHASDTRYTLDLSIMLLVAVLAGGVNRLSGAVPAAIVLVTLRVFVPDWSEVLPTLSGGDGGQVVGIVSGLLLLLIVFLAPGGIADGLAWLGSRLVVIRRGAPDGWQAYRIDDPGPSEPEPFDETALALVPTAQNPEVTGGLRQPNHEDPERGHQ